MSITSTKTGATGISLALDNNYMEPIATASGGASTITFNDIPQGYKHLQLRGILSNDAANYAMWTINGDKAGNYIQHVLYGDGASAGSTTTGVPSSMIAMGRPNYLGRSSGILLSAFVMDILDYTNTNKYKTTRTLTGWDSNGGGSINFESGLWLSTNPVTSISVTPTGTNAWVANSRISLYGIKG
jgi:hypothetical protein